MQKEKERFLLNKNYQPLGDQEKAIEELVEGLSYNEKYLSLLGATGTGKTFTMAKIIENLNKPTLVMAPNKTLAAQLVSEFKEFFPKNKVEYFVSYFDYYQPESYVVAEDLYIEKDSSVNDEIDRLRHSATTSLLTRKDTIVVASVSAIYGIGSPENYGKKTQVLEKDQEIDRRELLSKLMQLQYERNDQNLERGKVRVKGEIMEIQPSYAGSAYRIMFFDDLIEEIIHFDPLTGQVYDKPEWVRIPPASHYLLQEEDMERALEDIKKELKSRSEYLKDNNLLIEEQRLKQRTEYDLEMLSELGYCSGIENYSRILDNRKKGDPPYTLLDYFPKDHLVFLDESHQTLPQIGGMYKGDQSRKSNLVEHGFRLPSALDNRPLKFNEFLSRANRLIMLSATPGKFEEKWSSRQAEQIVRPTGILDPKIEIRKTKDQAQDLISEIKKREKKKERALVTTLTKKQAEDLTEYFKAHQIKAEYLHSDIDTLERISLLRKLRLGTFQVLVGVNLLREGLDLPEVSLVAILDADKEGFLRGETSLIQTIGRAARHINGSVLMYADRTSKAMEKAIEETDRRREIQDSYNKSRNAKPKSIKKAILKPSEFLQVDESVDSLHEDKDSGKKKKVYLPSSKEELEDKMEWWQEEMEIKAEELDFEGAAHYRDLIKQGKRKLERLERSIVN